MGYKNICLECRTSYSKGNDYKNHTESNCPQCGKKMILVNHKFKPPKKSETKSWEMVKLLVENGFKFQVVYEQIEKGVYLKVNYPKNLSEAKEFIKKYKP
ncbi:hypothetical protein ACFS5J_12420 [Flavobacterium chuncheonense]|uniref:Uncharacterized protein n=1 Tax=Flavobacterium chuncheonense TaxID=2026653 RepID=A0ABW5YP23_9FLAO